MKARRSGSLRSSFCCALFVFAFAHAYVRAGDPQAALAACPPLRLDVPGGSMEHVPVGYQDHVNICYAHAASEMVDAYRFSHPEPDGDRDYAHLTAPLDVAAGATIADDPGSPLTDGAYGLCPSIEYLKKNGSCSQAVVSQLYANGGASDFIRVVGDLDRSAERWRAAHTGVANPTAADQPRESMAPRSRESTKALAEKKFACSIALGVDALNDLSADSVAPLSSDIGEVVRHGTFNESVFAITEGLCMKNPRKKVSPQIVCNMTSFRERGAGAALAEAHRLLALPNPQPVGIKFCKETMTLGSSFAGKDAQGAKTSACTMHFALVIGRKPAGGGKCQLLIRDSHGEDATYAPEWQPPEKGGAWIDEEALARNSFALFTLDRR